MRKWLESPPADERVRAVHVHSGLLLGPDEEGKPAAGARRSLEDSELSETSQTKNDK